MNKVIEIYTDGSNVFNERQFSGCGWAYIVPELNIYESGKVYDEDGNITRMELTAILEALRYIATHKNNYLIYCDNLPIVKCFRGETTRKICKDIWNQIYVLLNQARKIGSRVDITFLDRKALDQNSEMFKNAQQVDKLAYTQANSLCLLA